MTICCIGEHEIKGLVFQYYSNKYCLQHFLEEVFMDCMEKCWDEEKIQDFVKELIYGVENG